MQDTILTKTLKIKNGKLIRNIENVNNTKKIIEIIKNKGLFGKSIVNTEIFSEEEKLIEHDIIPFIVHSGEYTKSMGYDVQKTAIEMALDFFKDGVYAWDLHAHNFTYHNGTWFLYDFGSFELTPKNVITQIRGFFKITFSNFEIQKILKRSELSHYYLTRYKMEDILKIIPFHRWLFLATNLVVCRVVLLLGLYKYSYLYLKKLFEYYTKDFKKEYYNFELTENEKEIFHFINNELSGTKTAFCVGEEASKWAIYNEETNSEITKFAYIDDYELCDKYYNFIYKKQFKNISTGVLYPLVDDNEIKQTKYRALYDSYAQYRFSADAVICFEETDIDTISKFTTDTLIIKSEKDITEELKAIFEDVKQIKNIFIAKNKRDKTKQTSSKKYEDANRGFDSKRQTWEVDKLIKQKRITNI